MLFIVAIQYTYVPVAGMLLLFAGVDLFTLITWLVCDYSAMRGGSLYSSNPHNIMKLFKIKPESFQH